MPERVEPGQQTAILEDMTIQRMDNVLIVVDDLDATLGRVRALGASLVGEVAQYEDVYRLCFVRGPEGIVVGLAEQLS